MVREWQLNLENTGGKKGLKDPLGYKVDTSGLTIRTGRDSSQQTQVETYERVSINRATFDAFSYFVFTSI